MSVVHNALTNPASMIHKYGGTRYLLNLIDTPVRSLLATQTRRRTESRHQGHVDFAWEVSRSLAACQGALLLVDATQGIQAQSISVFHIARERGLKIIPVLNKVPVSLASRSPSVSKWSASDRPSSRAAGNYRRAGGVYIRYRSRRMHPHIRENRQGRREGTGGHH